MVTAVCVSVYVLVAVMEVMVTLRPWRGKYRERARERTVTEKAAHSIDWIAMRAWASTCIHFSPLRC
jgi:hypothetical protein